MPENRLSSYLAGEGFGAMAFGDLPSGDELAAELERFRDQARKETDL